MPSSYPGWSLESEIEENTCDQAPQEKSAVVQGLPKIILRQPRLVLVDITTIFSVQGNLFVLCLVQARAAHISSRRSLLNSKMMVEESFTATATTS